MGRTAINTPEANRKVASMTPDRVESELIRMEAIKTQVMAVQARLVAEADIMQLPLSDGSRTLAEWVSARLDISQEHGNDLVTLARSASLDELDDGARTVDRHLARERLASAGAPGHTIEFSDGLDLIGVRRLAARHRRVTPVGERSAFERRHMAFQNTLDGNSTRFWGEVPGVDGAIVRDRLLEVGDSLPSRPTEVAPWPKETLTRS